MADGPTQHELEPRAERPTSAPPHVRPADPHVRPADPHARVARGTVGPGAAPRPTTTSDGMWRPEPALTRWSRRAITLPGLVLLTLLYTALLPVLLLHAALSDLVHRRPLLLCRFHLTFWAIFFWHCVGCGSLGLWWLAGKTLRWDPDRWREYHRRLEGWWSDKTLNVACVTYGARYVVEGAELVSPGPVLLLSRHASVLDTILPAKLLSRGKHGLVMRIVIKRELLWDPVVDLMCHQVPRAFVRRGSAAIGGELALLTRLTDDMDRDDVVVIFPEGTRFTPAKQAEVMAKLAVKSPDAAARAARLKNVLPPRPLGTLALLDARPDMDVVFCAHTGLEGANKLDDMVGGSLLGRTIRVKYWRVAAAEIPTERDARIAWLHGWWERIDQWIEQHRTN